MTVILINEELKKEERTVRIQQGGQRIKIEDMKDFHLVARQSAQRNLLWYHQKTGYPLTGNVKTESELIKEIEWLTDEMNKRELKQKPLDKNYIPRIGQRKREKEETKKYIEKEVKRQVKKILQRKLY